MKNFVINGKKLNVRAILKVLFLCFFCFSHSFLLAAPNPNTKKTSTAAKKAPQNTPKKKSPKASNAGDDSSLNSENYVNSQERDEENNANIKKFQDSKQRAGSPTEKPMNAKQQSANLRKASPYLQELRSIFFYAIKIAQSKDKNADVAAALEKDGNITITIPFKVKGFIKKETNQVVKIVFTMRDIVEFCYNLFSTGFLEQIDLELDTVDQYNRILDLIISLFFSTNLMQSITGEISKIDINYNLPAVKQAIQEDIKAFLLKLETEIIINRAKKILETKYAQEIKEKEAEMNCVYIISIDVPSDEILTKYLEIINQILNRSGAQNATIDKVFEMLKSAELQEVNFEELLGRRIPVSITKEYNNFISKTDSGNYFVGVFNNREFLNSGPKYKIYILPKYNPLNGGSLGMASLPPHIARDKAISELLRTHIELLMHENANQPIEIQKGSKKIATLGLRSFSEIIYSNSNQ